MAVNVDLLAKVLGLMESSNDHEALQAARRAAAMVRGTGWAALLRGPAPKDDVELAAEEVPLRKQIAEAFKELGEVEVRRQGFAGLLNKFRANDGYLSQAERAPLFAAVKRKRAGK